MQSQIFVLDVENHALLVVVLATSTFTSHMSTSRPCECAVIKSNFQADCSFQWRTGFPVDTWKCHFYPDSALTDVAATNIYWHYLWVHEYDFPSCVSRGTWKYVLLLLICMQLSMMGGSWQHQCPLTSHTVPMRSPSNRPRLWYLPASTTRRTSSCRLLIQLSPNFNANVQSKEGTSMSFYIYKELVLSGLKPFSYI